MWKEESLRLRLLSQQLESRVKEDREGQVVNKCCMDQITMLLAFSSRRISEFESALTGQKYVDPYKELDSRVSFCSQCT